MIDSSLLDQNNLCIVDVGAAGGIHNRWSLFHPFVKGILFEPNKNEYKKLINISDPNSLIINSALAGTKRRIEFYLTQKQECSSCYVPNTEFLSLFDNADRFNILQTSSIEVDTLTSQLNKKNITEVDFIKIDTQGSELDILEGGLDFLSRAVGIEVEMEFVEVYKGQPLFDEVHSFLTRNGFNLFDIKRYYWKRKNEPHSTNTGQLIFGDGLYYRSPENVLSIEDIDEKKAIRAIYVYIAYGYYDLARNLYELSKKEDILSSKGLLKLETIISKNKLNHAFPNFKGKDRIKKTLDKLASMFTGKGFSAGSDSNLGNK